MFALRPSRSSGRNKVCAKHASICLSSAVSLTSKLLFNICLSSRIHQVHLGSSPRCWLIEAALRRVVPYKHRQHEQAASARATRLGLQKAQGLASKRPSSQRTAFTAQAKDRSPYTRSCEEGSRLPSCRTPTSTVNWDQSGCCSLHAFHGSQKPPATARDHRPEPC